MGEKKLSEFLSELAQSAQASQQAFEEALAQLPEDKQEIVRNNDLDRAREVIMEETGQENVYFWLWPSPWILRWII